jgi:two-component system chemotaxis response regulator CheB
MAGHDIIVVGASAGGVEALGRLVSDLPEDLPAAVFVVLHVGPHWTTALPRILARHASLPVDHARDGEPIHHGRVYVALPDHHLLVGEGMVRVMAGSKENGHRPSIDTLFRSAAARYGPRVVGVVLSGNLDDGTAGLRAIHEGGGMAVVQDPDDALFPGMPESALAGDHADFVLPLREIGSLLSDMARKESRPEEQSPAMQADTEGARWTAYRALEERAALFRRLAERALSRHAGMTGEHFRAEAAEVSRQAEAARALLPSGTGGDDETESGRIEG